MLNLDGVFGYWDEAKTYHIRYNSLQYLVSLSCNFRLVAIATAQSRGVVTRLCNWLAEKDFNKPLIVFDAVYVFARQKRDRLNITHALLDFYDEN